MTEHPLDQLVSRVDFMLACIEEGTLEVSHDLYTKLLGPNYGRNPS